MIRTDDERADYLRTALEYVDGLPALITNGHPDQVHLELARIRSTLTAVLVSFPPPVRNVVRIDARLKPSDWRQVANAVTGAARLCDED